MGVADIAVASAQARRRRRQPPPVIAAVTALAQGVTAANAAAASAPSSSVAAAPQRHARQRAELQQLAETIIPALTALRTRLAQPQSPLALSLTGPTELERSKRLVNVERRLGQAQARETELAGKIRGRRGRRAEPITPLEAGLAILGAIPPVRAAEGAGLGIRALLKLGGEAGGETAARSAGAAATRATIEGSADVASRSTARTVASTAGRAAKGAAKGTAKAATYPIRHPIRTAKFQAAAQAPLAISSGDPGGELQKLLHGQGVVANALTGVGNAIGSAVPSELGGNLVRDVFDLPAQTIPALYMPAAAAVEAVQGDTSRAEQLWEAYKATGLIPAIASGDLSKVGDAVTAHPLFAALEARGAQAIAGRTAGAALRGGVAGEAGRELASTARKPLRLGGQLEPLERRYSPDLVEKAVQVLSDRRRAGKQGGQKATPKQVEKILRERVDRLVAQEEGARRGGRAMQAEGALEARPKGEVNRDAVSLAVQGIVRSPETFVLDLATYGRRLDQSAKRLAGKIEGADPLRRADLEQRLASNRALRGRLDEIARDADPEAVFASARTNVTALRETDRQLGEATGSEARLAQARLMPFARVHLGAKFGVSNANKAEIQRLKQRAAATSSEIEKAAIRGKISALRQREQLLDSKGDPLGPKQVEELRQRMGAEETGFVSQSPSARGPRSFYRSFSNQRQTLSGPRRKGKATVEGTFDHSYDALAEQRMRGQGMVDAIHGYDRTMQDFAVGKRRFEAQKGADGEETRSAFRVAEDAARHPELFGLPKDMALKPVRLAPLRAGADELRRAEEIFDHLDPSNQRALEVAADTLLTDAQVDGPGPAIVVPEQVLDRLREHVQSATTTQRAIQVISSGFKQVVLPFSPRWIAGNFFDVNMRTLLSGTTPYGFNAKLGRRILAELERQDPQMAERVKAGLVPGTLYGAAEGTRVFRDARQFTGTWLAPVARRMGALRRTPGPKQAVDLYVRAARGMMHLNEVFIERQPQYAMLGKVARRDLQATTGRWHAALGVSDDAVRDLAKALLQTPKQIQYAKEIEQTLGQWTANSPDAKRFLVTYMPFGMWSRAALRFVYLTIPAHHPIFAALASMAYEATQEERDALGLSLFADRPLPPSLQGSIPTPSGGVIPAGNLTSLGYTADWQRALAEGILPQIPLSEMAGYDWTGQALTHDDGTPLNPMERTGAVLGATLETYMPFLAMGKRVSSKGLVYSLNPLHAIDAGIVDYLRDLSQSQQISVPAHSSGGSSSSSSAGSTTAPWMTGPSSAGTAPWMTPTPSSGVAPWMR